jgi:RNA polymerase sigma-70 factor (ECF subfamily)
MTPPPDPAPDPAVRHTVENLPEPYKSVILMRYYGGLSCQDAAATLGVPLGTFTKQLSRAYALLRERLPSSAGSQEAEVQP